MCAIRMISVVLPGMHATESESSFGVVGTLKAIYTLRSAEVANAVSFQVPLTFKATDLTMNTWQVSVYNRDHRYQN